MDVITAILSELKTVSAVTDLVGTHAYGDELPEAAISTMPMSALVVRPSGGAPIQPGADLNVQQQRIDLVCYGATPYQADLLRRVARPALLAIRRTRQGDVVIHWINSAGGYLTGRDRDGQWPYAFASFQTLFSEVAP